MPISLKKHFLFLNFITVLVYGTSSYALREQEVYQKVVEALVYGKTCASTGENFWKVRSLTVPKALRTRPNGLFQTGFSVPREERGEYQVRFSQFGCDLGDKGVMVISPGRSESSPEYYETAWDFINKGYSPVYVIDHRGQGLAPRLLENKSKGHIVNFFHYINDFKRVVDHVVAESKANPQYSNQPFFLTSSSMGGAIALGYLQSFPLENHFSAISLMGPMIRVNYLSFVDREVTRFSKLIYNEVSVRARANLACYFGGCDDYANEEMFGDYHSNNLVFTPNNEGVMTHSEERFNIKSFLWNDFDWRPYIRDTYSERENWSGPSLGGATMNWVLTSSFFLREMRSKKKIEELPNSPILIITGTNDLRSYTPYPSGETDLSNHQNFCDDVNSWNRFDNSQLCSFLPLEGSFHEIFKESDEYRNQALQRVTDFFDTHNRP